jgi:VWFA-related protein
LETQFRPGDEAGVLTYAPQTGLKMVEYLTSDKAKVKKAIERAKEIYPSTGEASAGGPEDGATARADSPLSSFGGSNTVFVEGTSIFARAGRDFENNMSELAKALQHVPGAKNVIFFSGRGVGQAVGREFAASNTPVFTVNTNGWNEKIKHLTPQEKQALDESPLKDLALASGGKYFAHIKDVEMIADEVQSLSANYYVLGYYINETWDGRFHKIEVEVRRPGCQVFAQEGYYGQKPFPQLSELEKDLHLFDLIYADRPTSAGVLDAAIETLAGFEAKGSNAVVLASLPTGEKTGLGPSLAEFYMLIFDKDHTLVFSIKGEFDLKDHVQKKLYLYVTARLAPADYECRFAARDMVTGQAVVGRAPLKIYAPAAEGVTIYEPLLLVPEKEAQFINLTPALKKGVSISSLIDFYPLVPGQCAPLLKSLDPGVRTLLAIIPTEFRGNKVPNVVLDFKLTSSDGTELPIDTSIVNTKDAGLGRAVLAAEIDLPELPPGRYNLEITATNASGEVIKTLRSAFEKK